MDYHISIYTFLCSSNIMNTAFILTNNIKVSFFPNTNISSFVVVCSFLMFIHTVVYIVKLMLKSTIENDSLE